MTLTNDKYKFVFIHIPKNAGTTTRNIFNPLITKELGGTHQPLYKLLQKPSWKHVKKYYSFVFVRNPWDRALSLFHFYKTKHNKIRLPKNLGFNEWAINQFDNTNPNQGSILRSSVVKQRNRSPYKYTEEQFDQCRWIPEDVNYVGRVETFVEDINNIIDDLGITEIDRRTISEKRLNTTKHKPYHQVYSKEARDVIEDYFQRDIERFEYKFLKL